MQTYFEGSVKIRDVVECSNCGYLKTEDEECENCKVLRFDR